jgi:glucose/mannose-6-phosphate isomerase
VFEADILSEPMSDFDDLQFWKDLDPQNMRGLIENLPEQMSAALEKTSSLIFPPCAGIGNILVTGLGGSAIGGDVVRSGLGERIAVPYAVNRDYRLPAYPDSRSLVIACSYSGNTEETLNAYQQALKARAHVLCITSGGRLASAAEREGNPIVPLPAGLPPRAALGCAVTALLVSLQKIGVIPDVSEPLKDTIQTLRKLRDLYRAEVPEAQNRAKAIARSLTGKLVVVYGSSAILDSAAYRWRSQIEENAKTLAVHHVLPEMNHNELVGWRFPKEILSRSAVIFLRDREDHPQVQRRFALTRELIEPLAGVIHELWTEGESRLSRIFSLMYLGDFTSLYLAALNEIDPTPVTVIEELKRKLSE